MDIFFLGRRVCVYVHNINYLETNYLSLLIHASVPLVEQIRSTYIKKRKKVNHKSKRILPFLSLQNIVCLFEIMNLKKGKKKYLLDRCRRSH